MHLSIGLVFKVFNFSCNSQDEQTNDVIWYRCSVVSVTGDICRVFFVDYGNFEERSTSSLMELTGDELTLPVCTVCCCLRGCSLETMDTSNSMDITQVCVCVCVYWVRWHAGAL